MLGSLGWNKLSGGSGTAHPAELVAAQAPKQAPRTSSYSRSNTRNRMYAGFDATKKFLGLVGLSWEAVAELRVELELCH